MAREAVLQLSADGSDMAGGGGPQFALCGAGRVDGQGTGEGLRRCRRVSEARLRRERADGARWRAAVGDPLRAVVGDPLRAGGA